MLFFVARGHFDQSAREHAKHAHQLHHGEAASGLLAGTLRPALLVFGRVGHRHRGPINQLDAPSMPERATGNVLVHALDQMSANSRDHLEGNSGTCRAIARGAGAHGSGLLPGRLAALLRHDFAQRFAARTQRRLHLSQKAPEDDLQGKEPLATVVPARSRGQQSGRKIAPEKLAQLGQGLAPRHRFKRGFQRANRRFSKEQRAETFEKRSL